MSLPVYRCLKLYLFPREYLCFQPHPVGYRCVWLLVGFDQLALKAFQASHYGLISHAQRDDYLRRGAQSIHRSYGLVLGYRSSGITRRDILQNSSALTEQMASLDEDILLGKNVLHFHLRSARGVLNFFWRQKQTMQILCHYWKIRQKDGLWLIFHYLPLIRSASMINHADTRVF